MLGRCLVTKISASDLSWKFVKVALFGWVVMLHINFSTRYGKTQEEERNGRLGKAAAAAASSSTSAAAAAAVGYRPAPTSEPTGQG